jgi:hypothetical protein
MFDSTGQMEILSVFCRKKSNRRTVNYVPFLSDLLNFFIVQLTEKNCELIHDGTYDLSYYLDINKFLKYRGAL